MTPSSAPAALPIPRTLRTLRRAARDARRPVVRRVPDALVRANLGVVRVLITVLCECGCEVAAAVKVSR
jgi:hypothetical protein